jgi:nucleoside triphosphate diphosphatase
MSQASGDERLPQALLELDAITRRLRRDCPWDREQDERSIVPHTVEEAYELADAAHSGDDARLLDELGDVLFQVYFLSLLLEERGHGDLAAVAAASREKLVRRHPHIFGQEELAGLPTDATTPAEVRQNWDAIKVREGHRGEVAEALPSLTYARKRLKRAEPVDRDPAAALERVARAREVEPAGAHHGSDELYDAVGELLLAAVQLAAEVQVDPEIALRRAVSA